MKKLRRKNVYLSTNASKLSIISKIIIVVLVFGLIINHINFAVFAKAFNEPANIINNDDSLSSNEYNKVELASEKTKNSKTYRYENGLLETEIYNKAVHFLDNGKYENIDNTLISLDKGYKNNKNSYEVLFPYNLYNNKIELNYLNKGLNIYYDSIDSIGILDKNINRDKENLHDSISYKINDDVIIRYDLLNESIKENVILNKYINDYSYSFFIETELSLKEEAGELYFYNNDEIIYLFDNYLMYDLDYNISYDISTYIKQINEITYKIDVIPSNEYLQSAKYPVTIDPEIRLIDGGIIDGIVSLYEVDKLNNTSTFKSIGSFNVNNRVENTVTDDIVANIGIYIPRHYNTNISELLTRNQLMYASLELTTVSTNTSTDATAILKYDGNEIDRVNFHNTNVFNHKFNIIDAIGYEIENFITNDLYFNLELSASGADNTFINYSLGFDLGGDKPVIRLGYLSEAGLSDYYTYENFPINNESNCYVSHNSGNLTYIYFDYKSDSLLNLSHIYNTNRLEDSIYGSGFNINYNEYIEETSNNLILHKGNGKQIEFVSTSNNQYLSKDGTGDIIRKKYINDVLTGYEGDVDNSVYEYDTSGKLINIYLNKADRVNGVWSEDTKKLIINYTNNLITKIEDSYGNYINLTYDYNVNDDPTISQMGIDYLENIEVYKYNPSSDSVIKVRNISYEYDSGALVRIYKEYFDISTGLTSSTYITNISYNTRCQIETITRNNRGYSFIYDNRNRVEQVKVSNGNLTNGDYLDFSYNKNGKETYITNSKNQVNKYSFDNEYHTVKIENSNNYTTFYRYYDIYQDASINYNLHHKIINQSNSFKNISNIVTNHGFEVITNSNSIFGWTKDVSGTSSASIETNNILYGSRVLKLYKGTVEAKIYQEINVEENKEYIISTFIKNTNGGTGAYLDVVGVDGIVIPTSRTPNIKDTVDFNRYEYKFTSNFTGRVRIYLVNESSGAAYFDNVNVSENYIDTRYNYLENSSFEKGITGWSGYDYYVDNNQYFDNNCGNKSLLLANGYITQTINKTGDSGDVFVFGGYARYENYTAGITVSLTFTYLNNATETYTYTYNNPVEASEYYMIKATAQDEYISITLKIENSSTSSYVWVDNFSLYNEAYGINLSYNNEGFITQEYNEINDTTTSISYDSEGNVVNITTDNDEMTCGYDTRGNLNQIENKNVITSFEIDGNDNITSFTSSDNCSDIKYNYGSSGYTSDGLYPYQSTDILGNITTYTYDYLTGLISSVIDANNKYTNYNYDDLGNITTFVEGRGNETKTVNYTYDSEGNLTSITNGNTVYTFIYNSYNDLTSISINNEEIVSYSYNTSGDVYQSELLSETYNYGTINFEYYENGLVKSISHGNTKIQEFVYNDYNEVSIIIDYKEGVTYYYNYDYQNRLINVNASNGNNITYTYNTDSRLVSKANINGESKYTYSNVSICDDYENEQLTLEVLSNIYKISYEYSDDDYNNLDVISFYLNNNSIYSKEYIRETVTNDNQDYYTGRISELEYIVGNDTISYIYEYDDYNNITTINGYTNNVLTYYEANYYDYFNQLTAQELVINGTRYLSEYGYDYKGNIEGFYMMNRDNHEIIHSGSFTYNAKNQMISSTIDGISRTYTYQNNQLTSYNNYDIYYDYDKVIALVGNQQEIIYSYNANGIRTRKNINGVVTNYILKGNNIIRETRGNNVINYYYDSNDDVIGFIYNNDEYLYLKNLQNDVIGILNSNGNIVVKYYYDAYGNIISITDTSGINLSSINPFRYRSYYQDTETGWYYLNSRFYDPLIKRFITPDDISYLGASGTVLSYNLYSYCENNPIVLADYEGNDAKLILDFDEEGLIIVGHMALIVQDDEGNWHLIEYTGTSKKDAMVYIEPDEGRFGKGQGFWKSILSIVGLGGWRTLYIKGDFTESLKYARKYQYSNYGGYNLIFNNCLHFVRNALRRGKSKNPLLQLYFMFSTTIVPRIFFDHALIVSSMRATFLNKIRLIGGYYA